MPYNIVLTQILGVRKFSRSFIENNIIDAYYVSFNGAIYNDRIIAGYLEIPLNTYTSILINHGAKLLKEDNNFYFDNQKNAIEAIESIYIMMKLIGNNGISLNKHVKEATL